MLGMGGSGEDVTSVSMYILLKEDASTPVDELSRQISDACSNLGGEVTVSGSFDLGSMMTTLGGSGVSINLYGDDLDLLQSTAEEIAGILKQVDGVAEVDNGIGDTTPELQHHSR